ncbi:MAG: DUF3524 domain-containing protein [Phycisphaerales bacterium]|nr:MAG: DUF3524 domain-containing protein [Phycisphaerales bacterium]
MHARSPILRIVAFEPFDAGSHRAVRQSITLHARHRWVWLTRPGRAWKWRMRTAAPELLDMARREGTFTEPVDAIFATSLLSAADLRACLPRRCRDTPLVLYMHENQAAYPGGHQPAAASGERDAHFALTNLTSILAADVVLWNSRWNLRSFTEGIQMLLRNAPDPALPELAPQIEAKSEVIWPPVEPPPEPLSDRERCEEPPGDSVPSPPPDTTGAASAGRAPNGGRVLHNSASPIRILWPHRWEHDKGPEELLALARRHTENLNLRWTILGQQFSEVPPALQCFAEEFADRIDHLGFVPELREYWGHLRRCHWVLSTARHEFFGIAVVQAMLAGCLPWLPGKLSYPELLPRIAAGLSPASAPGDEPRVRAAILSHLQPALAPNAVARLEAAIEAAVAASA